MKEINLTGTVGKPSEPMSEQLAAAKLRKELALAEKHEVSVASEKATLVLAADVERTSLERFTTIRNWFLSLPAVVSAPLVGRSALQIEHELEGRVKEILVELS